MRIDSDVVIVGAGIGGALLALDLGRRGWRVALVEREVSPPVLPRPEVLWSTTLDALAAYGVADAIRDRASVTIAALEIGGETPWLRVTERDFARAGVRGHSTDPAMTRALLCDAAVATGHVEAYRGVTVDALTSDAVGVTGVEGSRAGERLSFGARLVVGDDGGLSIVRTKLGLRIELATFPVDFVTALVRPWPLASDRVRGWIRPRGFRDGIPAAICFPWPGNAGVLLMPLTEARANYVLALSPEEFWRMLGEVTPAAEPLRASVEFPRDFRRIARPFGHVESYIADGAALLGDAAHPMSPAGGQGANASIWDAMALAEVADEALRAPGRVSRTALAAYEARRRPVNERSVRISRIARRIFGTGRALPPAAAVPAAMKMLNASGWAKSRALRAFASTFVHASHPSAQ